MRQLMLMAGLSCLLLFGSSLLAQDQQAEPAEADSAAENADQNGEDSAPVGAAEERAAADEVEDFVPSEEVPPDEQVTFPVDI